jgi:hypothetical protein
MTIPQNEVALTVELKKRTSPLAAIWMTPSYAVDPAMIRAALSPCTKEPDTVPTLTSPAGCADAARTSMLTTVNGPNDLLETLSVVKPLYGVKVIVPLLRDTESL